MKNFICIEKVLINLDKVIFIDVRITESKDFEIYVTGTDVKFRSIGKYSNEEDAFAAILLAFGERM